MKNPLYNHDIPLGRDGDNEISTNYTNTGIDGATNDRIGTFDQAPIAICGMGMRLPGGIKNDCDLFSFLSEKGDARTTVPISRYDISAYHSDHGKPGTVASKHGYFLQDIDLASFDTSMFTMTATEVSRLDPSQRLLLEVVREAFENAGEADFRGKNIGTYTSVYSEDWQHMQNIDFQYGKSPYSLTGVLDFMLANRVAYEYDLRGPSVTLKAACASSAMALHQALQAIRAGEISSALVAGTNLMLAPYLGVTMSVTGLLAPDGSCKSFDAAADGYGRGEAVCCIYLKRLEHAVRDGNAIRAVIRASGSNSGGRTPGGLTNPNPAAHEWLIRRTYESAGIDCCDTAMVECHGTGTVAGDPLEASAMASCFGEKGVYIGSIKPNLGHSEGVAALCSIIKAVVSLERRVIIPNINFTNPNNAIPWASKKLCVPTELSQWPEDRCERISVHSYGVGGSNAHFIVDSARSFRGSSPADVDTHSVTKQTAMMPVLKHLLLFSANNRDGLNAICEQHLDYLKRNPDRIGSLQYTLAHRRERLQLSSFCVVDGFGSLRSINYSSIECDQSQTANVAFIFTGQGAQWVGMGRQLIVEWQQFRQTIDSLDKVLQSIEEAPIWRIKDILLHCDESDILLKPEIAQPVCTALQIALVDLLSTWGVSPQAVFGHSSGEIAAAYCAKILSSRAAIIIAFYRGLSCSRVKLMGSMAVVGMSPQSIQPFLRPGVCIACENSPENVTLSGDTGTLAEIVSTIQHVNSGAFVRMLRVPVAYHSEHMKAVGPQYSDWISRHAQMQEPQIPFISSTYGVILTKASEFGSNYWQENLERCVKFNSGAVELLKQFPTISLHLEIGPHSALRGPLREIYHANNASPIYLSCLSRDSNDSDTFLTAMGHLYCAGYRIAVPFTAGASVLTDLPTFPWQYGDQKFWLESRASKNLRYPSHGAHDLLGRRTVDSPDLEPMWRNILRLVDVPWLQDHTVGNCTIFPAVGYIAMAGEAICQLLYDKQEAHGNRGYTIRELHFTDVMILHNDEATEVITSLRPMWNIPSISGSWYEFTIMSCQSTNWTRHCRGLVTSDEVHPSPTIQPVPGVFTRKVDISRYYNALARAGVVYGPRFRGMQDVTSCVSGHAASCRVVDVQKEWESPYTIHPATLDIILQSFFIAQTRGICRNLENPPLPTFVKEVRVSGKTHRASIQVQTSTDGSNSSFHGTVDGKVVLSIMGLRTTQLTNMSGDSERHRPSFRVERLKWVPDINLLDPSVLMPPKPVPGVSAAFTQGERLYVLCAVQIQKQLHGIDLAEAHFVFYLNWLEKQQELFKLPGYPMVPDSAHLVVLTDEARQSLIRSIVDGYSDGRGGTSMPPFVEGIWRIYQYLPEILAGKIKFLEIMMRDGLLQRMYDWMNALQDIGDLFRLLGYSKPGQQILEIGAGTGGLTSKVLCGLEPEQEERLYSSYTFSDVSSGFFVQAQSRFKHSQAIEYKALDISQDPTLQGFQAGSYDLIIASNVLHATPCLSQTLANCRKLLRPDGRLVLQELSPQIKFPNFIMGLFSGWWLGREDGRVDEPYVAPSVWDAKLREAGFDGIDAVAADSDEAGCQMNSIILATPAQEKITVEWGASSRCVALLTDGHTPGLLTEATREKLEHSGYDVDVSVWGTKVPKRGQDVVCIVDVEHSPNPILHQATDASLSFMLELLDNVNGGTILWLSRPAQIECQEPSQAHILGFARTARLELGVRFATLELAGDGDANGAADAVLRVLQRLQRAALAEGANRDSQDGSPTSGVDMEYCWKNGTVHISRFHGQVVSDALIAAAGSNRSCSARRLVIGQVGRLSSLQWREQHLSELGQHEVRVAPRAIGMVAMEVRHAMGIVRTKAADGRWGGINAIGAEGAGIVVARGSHVKHIQVGDRVMWLSTGLPGFSTLAQMPSAWCIKMPDQLSYLDAATMPTAYVTALSALVHKARLRKGQSVLIHSAASDLGIAALHISTWIGAEIYAMVDSKNELDVLIRNFGLPSHRIFALRDQYSDTSILQATNGTGIDVVLCSQSGDSVHASWGCLAPGGCLVETSQTDTAATSFIPISSFLEERTMTSVNLSTLLSNHAKTQDRLQEMVNLYLNGHIFPVRPIVSFEAAKVQDAFESMNRSMNCGKSVVLFPEECQQELPLAHTVPDALFKSGAAYLLIGGTGGLGGSVASWMACNGAGCLIFLSPTAGQSTVDQRLFAELREIGCHVQCYAGSVADEKMLRAVVQQAALPIAGVIQLAMVLHDVPLVDIDAATWEVVFKPKVDGTWNLDRILPADLDFFVLASSIASIFGNYGQANYASANTFLDAFAQYRHCQGKAASVINLCAIDDIGYVSRVRHRAGIMSDAISEQDFLDAVQLAVAVSRPAAASPGRMSLTHIQRDHDSLRLDEYEAPYQILLVPEGGLDKTTILSRDPRMAMYYNRKDRRPALDMVSSDVSETLRAFVSSVAAEPHKLQDKAAVQLFSRAIAARVAKLLMVQSYKDNDPPKDSLAALGVDSLIGIELKDWCNQVFRVEMSVLELMSRGTISELAEWTVELLRRKYAIT